MKSNDKKSRNDGLQVIGYSLREAAAVLGVTTGTFTRWRDRGVVVPVGVICNTQVYERRWIDELAARIPPDIRPEKRKVQKFLTDEVLRNVISGRYVPSFNS